MRAAVVASRWQSCCCERKAVSLWSPGQQTQPASLVTNAARIQVASYATMEPVVLLGCHVWCVVEQGEKSGGWSASAALVARLSVKSSLPWPALTSDDVRGFE